MAKRLTALFQKGFFAFLLAGLYSLDAAPLKTPSQRFGHPNTNNIPSFRQHIVPLLGVRGCNGRECHGSFAGKGDLQLSLFGYDFDKDHKEKLHIDSYGIQISTLEDVFLSVGELAERLLKKKKSKT